MAPVRQLHSTGRGAVQQLRAQRAEGGTGMRRLSRGALWTTFWIAAAITVAGGWLALRSSAVLAEQVREADRTGGSIDFSPMLWAGEIGGFLVAAAAGALAIFAGVGLLPTAENRHGSAPVVPFVAAAVASVATGLVAGPYAFPIFLVAGAALLVVAARRYWAGGTPVS